MYTHNFKLKTIILFDEINEPITCRTLKLCHLHNYSVHIILFFLDIYNVKMKNNFNFHKKSISNILKHIDFSSYLKHVAALGQGTDQRTIEGGMARYQL